MEYLIMKRIFLTISVFGLFSATAVAGPSSMVAFDRATLALLANADAGNCSTCHGETGIAVLHQAANIAGQHASYTYKQLQDFKDGHRIEHEMNRFARSLSEQQMADMAAWYASLPPPTHSEASVDDNILKLVKHGDPARLLKSCNSCHGRTGLGGQFSHPLIAGQTREYLIQSLHDFRDGARKNDVWSRMRVVAEALTDEEIEGLADYYAGAQ
jgi:cytochrome c553